MGFWVLFGAGNPASSIRIPLAEEVIVDAVLDPGPFTCPGHSFGFFDRLACAFECDELFSFFLVGALDHLATAAGAAFGVASGVVHGTGFGTTVMAVFHWVLLDRGY